MNKKHNNENTNNDSNIRNENQADTNSEREEIEQLNSLSRESSATLFSLNSNTAEFNEYFQNNDDINGTNLITKTNSRTKIKNFLTKILSKKKRSKTIDNTDSKRNTNTDTFSSSASSLNQSIYDIRQYDYLPFYF
ncbi:hypothetical protein HANVADRAFT_51144 [Hanseniaspora valbyensis NRRL Y-1626]|uniref:Uncharacterized protein n=1 Tax=Hanseniaspora valbyensis NRRL Y-1626 TaxID=766949 RepID=A0A1B7TJ50_9ASCO|nr:hypothetical protein HANVADRAFT_51144 [Hanseniaspora valbyensis NRRL Y-1626]